MLIGTSWETTHFRGEEWKRHRRKREFGREMQQKTRGWWRSHRWQRATMLRGILAIIIDAVVHEMPFLPQGRSTHQSCHWQPAVGTREPLETWCAYYERSALPRACERCRLMDWRLRRASFAQDRAPVTFCQRISSVVLNGRWQRLLAAPDPARSRSDGGRE